MPALVAIEVTTQERDQAQWVAQMLEACSAALRSGTCVYSVNADVSLPLARVTWQSATDVTIAYAGPGSGAQQTERVLHFADDDAPQEKWRTVGFTTALLAGGAEEEQRAAGAPNAELPTTELPATELPTAESPTGFSNAVTARLLVATGLSLQSPRGGAQLRWDGRAWQAPWLVGAALEYSADPWQAPGTKGLASFTDLAAGASLLLQPVGQVQLFARLDVLARRLMVEGEKKDAVDAVSIWQPGLRWGLDLAWPIVAASAMEAADWWLVLGAHATFVGSAAEVRIDGKPAFHVPPFSAGAAIGVSYRR